MSKRTQIFLPYIPDEVIIDNILIRLPVKSVLRLRIVSKTWRSSLSDPLFARAHLNFHSLHEPQGAILVANNYNALWTSKLANETSLSKVTLPLALQETFSIVLTGSCHGLVLIELFSLNKMILFNPTTSETAEILECNQQCVYGLGYDSSEDDYKIVEIDRSGIANNVGIYSVRSKTWRLNVSKSLCEFSLHGGVFVNGFLHWLVLKTSSSGKLEMAAFNFAREDFETVPLPCDIYATSHFKWLETRCSWRVPYAVGFEGPCFLVLWVMKKYGVQDSWTKHGFILPEITMCTVCGALGEDELVLKTSDEKESVALIWRNGEWRCMDDISFNVTEAIAFRESLISPNL